MQVSRELTKAGQRKWRRPTVPTDPPRVKPAQRGPGDAPRLGGALLTPGRGEGQDLRRTLPGAPSPVAELLAQPSQPAVRPPCNGGTEPMNSFQDELGAP